MPSGGAAIRAEQLATVGRIAHTKFISAEIGRLLDDLRDWGEQHEYDSFEASLIRVAARDWEKASKVPPDLRAEMSRSASLANPVWVAARRDNDFASFLPVLRKNLDLRKRYIDCFEVGDEPYDIVLDDYERGMKTAEVRRIFDYLKEHQAPLVKEVAERGAGREAREDVRHRRAEDLRARGRARVRVHRRLVAARPDRAPVRVGHRRRPTSGSRRGTSPTASRASSGRCTSSGTGCTSTRSTRRSSARRSPAACRSACTSRRAACGRTSSAGRSRSGAASSRARRSSSATRSPTHDAESWYREVNAVEPSLIRVEADEATYNLHIILRFELEQAMLADEFPLEQLPEEWNRRMWEYLGIEVPNDTLGVLQDVHWSGGSIGYFPTYALGNLISAQIWERITAELPDLSDAIEAGDFAPLRDWLRENLHRHGRKFTPAETLERVVGTSQIDPEPYVRYLREKLAGIYGIAA